MAGKPKTIKQVAKDFLKNTKKGQNGCINWTGYVGKNGYGSINCIAVTGKRAPIGAHRLAWLLFIGDIPEGLFVCHKCDNPLCVNICHLFLDTHIGNMADKVRKGRGRQGHLYGCDNPNSKISPDDVRKIRELYGQGVGTPTLAKKFGVSQSNAYRIVKNISYTNIGD